MTSVGRSPVGGTTLERADPHIGLQAAPPVDHLASVNLLGDEHRGIRGDTGVTRGPGTDLPKVNHLVRDADDDVEIHVRLIVAPRTRPDVADLDGPDEVRSLGGTGGRTVSLVVRRTSAPLGALVYVSPGEKWFERVGHDANGAQILALGVPAEDAYAGLIDAAGRIKAEIPARA